MPTSDTSLRQQLRDALDTWKSKNPGATGGSFELGGKIWDVSNIWWAIKNLDDDRLTKYFGGSSSSAAAPAEQEDPDAKMAREEKGKLQAFYDEMLKGYNPNDPSIQRLMSGIRSSASTSMRNRGMQGGMADASVARAMSDTGMNIDLQRKQLGVQALQGSLGDSRSLIAYRDALERDAANTGYENSLADWETQRGSGQMAGSAIGGGLGAAIGGIGGFFAGGPVGALMGAGAGLSAGSSIGGGFGGMGAGVPPQRSPFRSRYSRGGY